MVVNRACVSCWGSQLTVFSTVSTALSLKAVFLMLTVLACTHTAASERV